MRLCTNSTWCFSHHRFFLYYRVKLGHLAQRQGCLPYSQYLLQSPFLLLVSLVFVSFYCYIADRSVWEVQSETIFLYFGAMSQLQQNMRSLKTKITKVACPWVCKNPSPSSDVHVSYQGLQLSYIFCSSLYLIWWHRHNRTLWSYVQTVLDPLENIMTESERITLTWTRQCVLSRFSLVQVFATPCGLQGFSVHEIFQARILEWVAILFLQGVFPTQGSPVLQVGSLPLNHQGSPNKTININVYYCLFHEGKLISYMDKNLFTK